MINRIPEADRKFGFGLLLVTVVGVVLALFLITGLASVVFAIVGFVVAIITQGIAGIFSFVVFGPFILVCGFLGLCYLIFSVLRNPYRDNKSEKYRS